MDSHWSRAYYFFLRSRNAARVITKEGEYNFDMHVYRTLVTNLFPADYDYEAPWQNLRHRCYATCHSRDRWLMRRSCPVSATGQHVLTTCHTQQIAVDMTSVMASCGSSWLLPTCVFLCAFVCFFTALRRFTCGGCDCGLYRCVSGALGGALCSVLYCASGCCCCGYLQGNGCFHCRATECCDLECSGE